MKILKFNYSDLKKVNKKDEVMRRLYTVYKATKASVLYAFYLNIIVDGYKKVINYTPKATFYRKIKELKDVGVDFSQSADIVYEYNDKIEFNPFDSVEVV